MQQTNCLKSNLLQLSANALRDENASVGFFLFSLVFFFAYLHKAY